MPANGRVDFRARAVVTASVDATVGRELFAIDED